MSLALSAAAFVPGLAIGSFLNVVAARVPRKRSIVSPGSACMSCGHELAWTRERPRVSWLVLRGKCRGCGERIGLVYPAVELVRRCSSCLLPCLRLVGRVFLAAFFCATLVTVSATDLSHRIVPNVSSCPAGIVFVAMTLLEPSAESALGAFGAACCLFLAALAYPKGMGMGDVKLALLLGAMLGRMVPVGLMIGMVAASCPRLTSSSATAGRPGRWGSRLRRSSRSAGSSASSSATSCLTPI